VKYDGIINFTPDKSFAVTFKEKDINKEELKNDWVINFKVKSFAAKCGSIMKKNH
jgi:hypothetical protein